MEGETADDLRNALRLMRQSPGFTATAVIVVALGCALTGAVFSTVNGWLSLARVIPSYDRLVFVSPTRRGAEVPLGYFKATSYAQLFDRRLHAIRYLFATTPSPAILSAGDLSVNVRLEAIAGDYFAAVGVAPLLGRTLNAGDERAAEGVPVVLSEGAWQRLFAGDDRVVGRSIRLSGLLCTVVGVIPAAVRGFTSPTTTAVDIWAPVADVRSIAASPKGEVWVQVFGRLTDGASVQQAGAELAALGIRFDGDDPDLSATALPIERGVLSSRARLALIGVGAALVALSSLVLFIACSNLASLFLARAASRLPEVAVRMALGAGPAQILRLHLVEASVITAAGGAAGYAMVLWVSRIAGRFTVYTSGGSVMSGTLLIDGWVMAYFVALAASAALAIGLLPALRAVRIDPALVLASSGARGRATGRFERRRTPLVASQVAASTVLLVVAGLFVRSAWRAAHYDVAFAATRVVTGAFDFGPKNWDESRGLTEQRAILQTAQGLPAIAAAAIATGVPAAGGGELADIETATQPLNAGDVGPPCRVLSVSPGFFTAMGIGLHRGRDFTNSDGASAGGVAIVNVTGAARLWPNTDPVGQRLRIRKGHALDVIALAEDTDRTALEPGDRCYVYVPIAQRYSSRFLVAVRGASPGVPPVGAVREMAVSRTDVPMFDIASVSDVLARAGDPSRSIAAALALIGVSGLTIAMAGLYGVMAYLVGLRRAEFGIRKVLGATNGEIYALVLGDASRMVGLGLLIGLPLAYVVALGAGRGLIGVAPHDPVTFIAVPSALASVAAFAAWWPARRAARVEPATTLREM